MCTLARAHTHTSDMDEARHEMMSSGSSRPMIWTCAGILLAGGCTAPRPKLVVTDPDPSVKIPAIKQAVRHHDLDAVTQLVKDLENDDPAVRFYAIEALHRLTSQRFGYDYYASEPERAPAVQRWQEWLAEQRAAAAPNP